MMEKEKIPQPPREGIVYGEIAYWVLLVGVFIAVIGLLIYMMTPGYVDKKILLDNLWQGAKCNTIWEVAGGVSQPPAWYDSLGMLAKGDMLAVLGIAIACLAAMLGMWGATVQLVRSRVKLYIIFAFIIAVVLTLSASGLITISE
jgi:hypothetical protein